MKKTRLEDILMTIPLELIIGLTFVIVAIAGNNYITQLFILSVLYLILGMAIQLYLTAGLLDLGFIAFFAIGAYSVIISAAHGWPVVPVLLIGAGLSGTLAWFLSWVAVRTVGDYFAVITLAFGEVIRIVIRNEASLTGGTQGIEIPVTSGLSNLFGSNPITPAIYVTIAGVAAASLTTYLLRRRLGYTGLLFREAPESFLTSTLKIKRSRLMLAITGGLMAFVAGVFFGLWNGYVSPTSFSFFESLMILVMALIGAGLWGFLPGLAVGVLFIIGLPEYLKEYGEYRYLAFGVFMLLAALFRPQGVFGISWWRWEAKRLKKHFAKDRYNTGDSNEVEPEYIELNLKGLNASYHNSPRILHDIRLKLDNTRINGLFGFNGAGKSTLFKVLAGKDLQWEGEIEIRTSKSTMRFTRKDLNHLPSVFGLIEQRFSLALELSPLQYAYVITGEKRLDVLASQILSILSPAFQDNNAPALTMEDLWKSLQELGYYKRRLVELALVLLRRPAVLLLDEPLAGMHPVEAQAYRRVIISQKKHRLILWIEHNLGFISSVPEHLIFLSGGRAVTTGTFEEISKVDEVREYLGSLEQLNTRQDGKLSLPDTSKTPLLEATIHWVAYERGGAKILQDIQVQLGKGHVIFVTGLTMTGKTTLLTTLSGSGLLKEVAAKVEWSPSNGQKLNIRPGKGGISKGIFFVPDHAAVFSSLTPVQMLYLIQGRSDKEALRVFKELIESLSGGVFEKQGDISSKKSGELSGGQQRLVGVMAAIASGLTRIKAGLNTAVLVDEPSNGVQRSAVLKIYSLINIGQKQGIVMTVTDQDPSFSRGLESISALTLGGHNES